MTWTLITLDLPPDTPIGLPRGRWERVDGRIRATFTRDELVVALGMLEVSSEDDLLVGHNLLQVAADFEKQIAAMAMLTAVSSIATDELRQAALKLGRESLYSPVEAANTLVGLLCAGISWADIQQRIAITENPAEAIAILRMEARYGAQRTGEKGLADGEAE